MKGESNEGCRNLYLFFGKNWTKIKWLEWVSRKVSKNENLLVMEQCGHQKGMRGIFLL